MEFALCMLSGVLPGGLVQRILDQTCSSLFLLLQWTTGYKVYGFALRAVTFAVG